MILRYIFYLTIVQGIKINALNKLSEEASYCTENIAMTQNKQKTDLLHLLGDFTVVFQSRLALLKIKFCFH